MTNSVNRPFLTAHHTHFLPPHRQTPTSIIPFSTLDTIHRDRHPPTHAPPHPLPHPPRSTTPRPRPATPFLSLHNALIRPAHHIHPRQTSTSITPFSTSSLPPHSITPFSTFYTFSPPTTTTPRTLFLTAHRPATFTFSSSTLPHYPHHHAQLRPDRPSPHHDHLQFLYTATMPHLPPQHPLFPHNALVRPAHCFQLLPITPTFCIHTAKLRPPSPPIFCLLTHTTPSSAPPTASSSCPSHPLSSSTPPSSPSRATASTSSPATLNYAPTAHHHHFLPTHPHNALIHHRHTLSFSQPRPLLPTPAHHPIFHTRHHQSRPPPSPSRAAASTSTLDTPHPHRYHAAHPFFDRHRPATFTFSSSELPPTHTTALTFS